MTGGARLRRQYTCHHGFDIEAVRQDDGRWDVGPWLGDRLGWIVRLAGYQRWQAVREGGEMLGVRPALWAACLDLCPGETP